MGPFPARVTVALVAAAGGIWGCEPVRQRKPLEMTTPNSATPSPIKESTCAGGEFDDLEKTLEQCEVKMPGASDLPSGMRDKLELRVTSGTPSIAAGGHVDITVTLKNKSKAPLALYFTGDPQPKFDVEAVDAKGRRVDLPAGKPPKTPVLPTHDVKASQITLGPGGSARVKIPWDAVKTRWAPEKIKSWDGRGYPRAAAGPLPAGKYTLRIVLPLVGVFEKGELEPPKLPVDVGS